MTTRRMSDAVLPTRWGDFRAVAFRDDAGNEHLALCVGLDADTDCFEGPSPVLVRLHSECMTGDIFGSMRCDCQAQLHAALEAVHRSGRGVVLYLRGHGCRIRVWTPTTPTKPSGSRPRPAISARRPMCCRCWVSNVCS